MTRPVRDNRSIRDATRDDAGAVAEIYNPYVLGSTVSFEEEAVTTAEMGDRIASHGGDHPWLVLEERGLVLGYAYASRWRERCSYRGSAETSVYVAGDARGRGIGKALYEALIERLSANGMHVAIGGVALPNDASVALHESLGFRQVARFPEVGRKFGRWIDVGYWALVLRKGETHPIGERPCRPGTEP